ncbi:MAG: type II toxin-antitoxin system HicA family toxin [Candidatus Gastranaerophilales bacterium]|nr:type II toxin-antitoxin system HicA family toxin [Candidatus Gastranaerophilales bacterium]
MEFGSRADKLIKGLKTFTKTPRDYPRGDVEVVLKSLGFNYSRTHGSHRIYRNQHGDVFEFVGKSHTVDPATVEQLRTWVEKVNR